MLCIEIGEKIRVQVKYGVLWARVETAFKALWVWECVNSLRLEAVTSNRWWAGSKNRTWRRVHLL